jgi:hypothetical protein
MPSITALKEEKRIEQKRRAEGIIGAPPQPFLGSFT